MLTHIRIQLIKAHFTCCSVDLKYKWNFPVTASRLKTATLESPRLANCKAVPEWHVVSPLNYFTFLVQTCNTHRTPTNRSCAICCRSKKRLSVIFHSLPYKAALYDDDFGAFFHTKQKGPFVKDCFAVVHQFTWESRLLASWLAPQTHVGIGFHRFPRMSIPKLHQQHQWPDWLHHICSGH